MDCFLLPFIFSIRAAITILLLLQQIILPATMRFTASFIKQAFQWFLFVVNLFLTTKFGSTLWSIFSTVLCIVLIVLIVFYTFYKSIHDFGPKHRKRSFIDILSQPVPGIEFKEQTHRKPTKQILLCVTDSITGLSIVDFFGTRFFLREWSQEALQQLCTIAQ